MDENSVSVAGSRLHVDPRSSDFDTGRLVSGADQCEGRTQPVIQAKARRLPLNSFDVNGSLKAGDYLATFGNAPLRLFRSLGRWFSRKTTAKVTILHAFEGFVRDGEMLAVLGRPGSSCTTLLKTLAGEAQGLPLGPDSQILYQGIVSKTMHSEFRRECIYTAGLNVCFPELTVLETLQFAAASRAPRNLLPAMTTVEYVEHMKELMLWILGLQGTRDTPISNALIRGVSDGSGNASASQKPSCTLRQSSFGTTAPAALIQQPLSIAFGISRHFPTQAVLPLQ